MSLTVVVMPQCARISKQRVYDLNLYHFYLSIMSL